MDAVLARRETEEGTESNDLLLQQAETEERQTDGRNAEEPKGRRQQAHGPSVSPQGLSPTSRTPPAEAKWGGPRPFLLLIGFRIRCDPGRNARTLESEGEDRPPVPRYRGPHGNARAGPAETWEVPRSGREHGHHGDHRSDPRREIHEDHLHDGRPSEGAARANHGQ